MHPTPSPEPVAEHAAEDDAPEVAQVLNARMAALQVAAQPVYHLLVDGLHSDTGSRAVADT